MTTQIILDLPALLRGTALHRPAAGHEDDGEFASLLDRASEGEKGTEAAEPVPLHDAAAGLLLAMLPPPASPPGSPHEVPAEAPRDAPPQMEATGLPAPVDGRPEAVIRPFSERAPDAPALGDQGMDAAGPAGSPAGLATKPEAGARPGAAIPAGADPRAAAGPALRAEPLASPGPDGRSLPSQRIPRAEPGPRLNISLSAPVARGGESGREPVTDAGERPDGRGGGSRDRPAFAVTDQARGATPGTSGQNFNPAVTEMAPKRLQPEGAAVLPSRPGMPDLRPTTLMPKEDPVTAAGSPVTDVDIRFGTASRLEVRIGVDNDALAGRIAAETGRLAENLSAVGAELDALRVEVRSDLRAWEPAGGRGPVDRAQADQGPAAAPAATDAAARDTRRETDGGGADRAERLAEGPADADAEDRGRRDDTGRQAAAGEERAGANGWDEARTAAGDKQGGREASAARSGVAGSPAGSANRLDRLA